MKQYLRRSRRGTTLIEVMAASMSASMVLFCLADVLIFASRTWARADAAVDAKQALALAVGRMEPTIRAARRVDTTHSNAQTLTVVLPKVDSTTGEYVVPMQDGDVVAFYLSDTSGAPGASGTLLWRSVNGVPDSAWSLEGSRRRVDLRTNGLSFTYAGSPAVISVQLSVSTVHTSGTQSVQQTAATELFLRNNSYQ